MLANRGEIAAFHGIDLSPFTLGVEGGVVESESRASAQGHESERRQIVLTSSMILSRLPLAKLKSFKSVMTTE